MAQHNGYLDQPAKPCPAYVRGERVWFPGEFSFSTVRDVRWHGGNWEYIFDIDLADEAEKAALEDIRQTIIRKAA